MQMEQELVQAALAARENAYAPYSDFRVGAALLAENGKIYLGCNVENAAFGPTNCAERTAVFSAVCDGQRRFRMLAVAGGKNGEAIGACFPCGVCRQVLSEFCGPDFPVLVVSSDDGAYQKYTLQQLLPFHFTL